MMIPTQGRAVPGEMPNHGSGITPPFQWPPTGQTTATTDRIPAWLTRGEAVLNKGAAHLAGRHNIDRLNKLGTQGFDQGIGYVDTKNVDPIWQEIQLQAPHLDVAALREKAKQSGITPSMVRGLVEAIFKGHGTGDQMTANYQAAGSPTPVYGESGYPSAIPAQGYRGGSRGVGGQQPSTVATGAYPTPGGIDFPAANMGPEFTTAPEHRDAIQNGADLDVARMWGSNPWTNPNFNAPFGFSPPGGLPGSWQGPTQIPTFFDTQGYPYAVPALPGSDYNQRSSIDYPALLTH